MLVVALIAAGALIALLSDSDTHNSHEVNNAKLDEPAAALQSPSIKAPVDAEQELRQSLQAAGTEDGRVAVLEDFRARPDARSMNTVLRTTMLADNSPKVRLKAFEVAKALAMAEGREETISILRDSVRNPYAEVQREGLRACRDHPHFELMDELVEVVRRGGSERPVAIQALAFLDEPDAQRLVLESAQSTTLPRAERIQAVALLCELEIPEAVEYLKALAAGEDAELKAYAIEALAVRQARTSK